MSILEDENGKVDYKIIKPAILAGLIRMILLLDKDIRMNLAKSDILASPKTFEEDLHFLKTILQIVFGVSHTNYSELSLQKTFRKGIANIYKKIHILSYLNKLMNIKLGNWKVSKASNYYISSKDFIVLFIQIDTQGDMNLNLKAIVMAMISRELKGNTLKIVCKDTLRKEILEKLFRNWESKIVNVFEIVENEPNEGIYLKDLNFVELLTIILDTQDKNNYPDLEEFVFDLESVADKELKEVFDDLFDKYKIST